MTSVARVISGLMVCSALVGITPATPATPPSPQPAKTFDTNRPEIQSFISKMSAEHEFKAEDVQQLLAQAETKQSILDAMAKPAEKALLWHEYRTRFMTEKRIAQGVEFWQEHRELLERVEKERGVPAQYILAILGVETLYGRNVGRYRVVDALSTLAFDYPPRSSYFLAELEQFLLLTREESLDPLTVNGSYAGAMGPSQFMPRSVRKFAVDEDEDGKREMLNDWPDIIASVANYLREHGWNPGQAVMADATVPDEFQGIDTRSAALSETVASLHKKAIKFDADLPGHTKAALLAADYPDGIRYRVGFENFGAIARYNRSILYAMAIHDLATELAARALHTSDQAPSPP